MSGRKITEKMCYIGYHMAGEYKQNSHIKCIMEDRFGRWGLGEWIIVENKDGKLMKGYYQGGGRGGRRRRVCHSSLAYHLVFSPDNKYLAR
jgi:hypothetical protein